MTVAAILVEPAAIDLWLPRIASRIARVATDRYSLADVIGAIRAGRVHLWVMVSADAVVALLLTEFVDYPRQRACRFVGCVGKDWRTWMHVFDDIRAWARDQGCARMEAMAPAKYRHMLTGYKIDHVLFARAC